MSQNHHAVRSSVSSTNTSEPEQEFEPPRPADSEPEAPDSGEQPAEPPEAGNNSAFAEPPEARGGRMSHLEHEFTHGRSQS